MVMGLRYYSKYFKMIDLLFILFQRFVNIRIKINKYRREEDI